MNECMYVYIDVNPSLGGSFTNGLIIISQRTTLNPQKFVVKAAPNSGVIS